MKRFGGKWDPSEKAWRVPLSSPIIRWLEHQGVDLPEDLIEKRDETLTASRASEADISVPAPAGCEYRPFQKAGVAWVLEHPGTLIGDEMRLGKQQPFSEPVLTPTGWRLIGSLAVGNMAMGA